MPSCSGRAAPLLPPEARIPRIADLGKVVNSSGLPEGVGRAAPSSPAAARRASLSAEPTYYSFVPI